MEKTEDKNYKTPIYLRKAYKNYYDRIKDTPEFKKKNNERYAQNKRAKYIAENSNDIGFEPPKPRKKNLLCV